MFSYYKPAAFTVVFALMLSAAFPAGAKDEKPRPLHIKVSGGKAVSGIRIHKGQVPSEKPKQTKQAPAPVAEKGIIPAVMAVSPKAEKEIDVEIEMACAMNHAAPLSGNRIDNMADSLKAYLRTEKRDPLLIDTLLQAAKETNTDFELLIIKAMLESDLGRLTKSSTSSASGIFQYIESTWLVLMRRYGEEIGYPHYASAIEIDRKTGQPYVMKSSSLSKDDILAQRYNPYIAAMIKAHQIKDESELVETYKNGGRLTATDHYIAHMLGLTMAEEFYKLKNTESHTILAYSPNPMFREAAALNPAFFYDDKHRALTAVQAYSNFKTRIASAYKRLRGIEAQYGADKMLTSTDCEGEMPAVRAANVEKTEILPARGLSLASASAAMSKLSN